MWTRYLSLGPVPVVSEDEPACAPERLFCILIALTVEHGSGEVIAVLHVGGLRQRSARSARIADAVVYASIPA